MPDLLDPNFRRTVVLVVHHSDEGTVGVVLNRPTDILALELCKTLDVEWRGHAETVVHWGGPVQPNTGWVVSGCDALAGADEATPIMGGVHFAGSLDALRRVAATPPASVRLFLGYSGWGPGQLEDELAQGAWVIAPHSEQAIFEISSEELWDHAWRTLGVDPATVVGTPGVH